MRILTSAAAALIAAFVCAQPVAAAEVSKPVVGESCVPVTKFTAPTEGKRGELCVVNPKPTPRPRVRVYRHYDQPVRHVHRPPPTFDNRGHETNWMQRQIGLNSCSQFRTSCYRGANKPGHGLAYPGVCEARWKDCMERGTWVTTNTGVRYGLSRH